MEGLSEENIKIRKRKIRKLGINFFAVMIILTFFSSTINNFSLPKVTIERPVSDYITKEIDGEGLAEAKEPVKVYMQVSDENQSGKIIDAVKVKVGDKVTKDQTLVEFKKQNKKEEKDKADLEAQLSQENITYNQYSLKLEELKNENSYSEKTLQRKTDEAKDKMDSESKNLDIIQKLFGEGVEVKANLDKQIGVYNDAKRAYEQASDDYNKALKSGQNSIKDMEYNLQMEKAKIDKINMDICSFADNDSSSVLSPCDGVVTQINFENGQMVDTSKPILIINDISRGFQFRMKVSKEAAKYLAIGDSVEVKLENFEGKTTKGEVKEISDSKNNKSDGNENSKEDLNSKDIVMDIESDGLKGGETGEGYISKKISESVTTVPNSAINSDNNGKFLWIVEEKTGVLRNKAILRKIQVTTGESDNSKTAILSPIDEEAKVVIKVEADKSVSDGCNVMIKN